MGGTSFFIRDTYNIFKRKRKTLALNKSYGIYIVLTRFSCFNMIVIRTCIGGLQSLLKMKPAATQASGIIAKTNTIFSSLIVRWAITVISTVIILMAYPFLQR